MTIEANPWAEAWAAEQARAARRVASPGAQGPPPTPPPTLVVRHPVARCTGRGGSPRAPRGRAAGGDDEGWGEAVRRIGVLAGNLSSPSSEAPSSRGAPLGDGAAERGWAEAPLATIGDRIAVPIPSLLAHLVYHGCVTAGEP